MTCANCGAIVPMEKAASLDLCCIHCSFNPLGCRCQFGDFGVAQEPGPWMDEDEIPAVLRTPELTTDGGSSGAITPTLNPDKPTRGADAIREMAAPPVETERPWIGPGRGK